MRQRGSAAVEYRINCAWTKYRKLQHVMEDRNISIALRLKLFDAVVTPTLLYSLDTCPMTSALEQRVDIVQRKMLRRMVGWVTFQQDTWHDIGLRMQRRLQQGLARYPVASWSDEIRKRKATLFER